MKEFKIMALLVCGMLAGCAENGIEMQIVRLEVGGVRSGSIGTKSAEDVLGATAPDMDITLVMTGVEVSERRYEVVPGQEVVVPVGRYRVEGQWRGTRLGEVRNCAVWDRPSWKVSQEVNVVAGTAEYAVSGQYECFALVIDYGECSGYKSRVSGDAGWSDFAWMQREGDWGVAYVHMPGLSGFTWTWDDPWWVRAVPVDVIEHEARDWRFVTQNVQGGVHPEAGKWYLLSPTAVTLQSGSIAVSLPEWVRGN